MELLAALIFLAMAAAIACLAMWVINLRKKVLHRDELIADLKDAIGAQEPSNDWRKSVL